MSHIFYGILIWICVEIALVLCIVVVLVAFEFCKGIIKGIADMIAKLKAPKNAAQPPQATPPTESKTTSETKLIENKATIPKSDVSGQEIHAYKGVFMNPSKAPMGFYDLKAYLIIHKAGCLSWIAEHALKNFGWVCLNEIHQVQGAHIAWGDITDDQIYKGKEVHYFFAGICTERQRAQNPISFKDKAEVISFLVQVFKPYVLQDPNHVYHLSEAHDNLQSVDIPMERFSRRLYLEIVKIWGTEFAATLEEILLETDDLPREAHMLIKDLPFLPKEVALALEQYRDGNIYAFSTMHQTPKDLPPFNRPILRNALTGALKSGQGGLAGVVDRLVRPEREPVLKRKARKQLAKIWLRKFYGVLPLERFAEFKLDTPFKNSSLEAHSFMCQGQKHYYIDSALWLWTATRLLQIFNGSVESRGIEEALLSRLSSKQAGDFTLAFGNDPIECLRGSVSWDLISHLHLPLSVFKEQDHLIIAPNPNFKPNVFLDKKPHDREMVRLLYSFNTLSPQEKQEALTNLRHLIPDYALRHKLPIIPEILREEFIKWCNDGLDEDTEVLFFDDREEFLKIILDMQEQFLTKNLIPSTPKILSPEEAKEAKEKALQAQIKQAKQALEKDFAKWCDNSLDEDTEALFFDNRIKFFQKILQMQWHFIHEKTNPQTSLKQTPIPSKYSPKAIKAYLDQFVIGQENAKKGMSLVFSDHYKRISGQSTLEKANAICIGPSGSGKTYLIEMATKYLDIPYCIANAAAFTPTGYIGNETNQMFATLYSNAGNDKEKAEQGVLVLDEIDKLGQGGWHDKEWRQGVQNELLKVIEKGFVSFDYGNRAMGEKITLKTENMLFIILGHFEKLWHNNQEPDNVLFGKVPKRAPKFTNEDLMECGMKREFLRRFAVRVVFEPVDIDMLTELLDRRLKPFEEEFIAYGSALEFSQNAKRALVQNALNEGIGMSGLDQKLHEILMPLRFDLEDFAGFKCVITQSTLRSGRVRKLEL
ncbi:AAA family ATPase [Helicobacter ailurogastricus]|uniref:AAA family ATPase n=1 Tax=Helicobacter ailurogastricus TaxID=1578720 RepID=UPI001F272615|nr:AAA family ATPase [Helicobacter ailurogastricus]